MTAINIEYYQGLAENLPAETKAAIAAAAELVLSNADCQKDGVRWLGQRIADAYNQMHGPTFDIKVCAGMNCWLVRVFPLMAG